MFNINSVENYIKSILFDTNSVEHNTNSVEFNTKSTDSFVLEVIHSFLK